MCGSSGKSFSIFRHCERCEAIHAAAKRKKGGLLRGVYHRARIRATRWLAMTLLEPQFSFSIAMATP
jgi:cytochrome c2